MCWTAWFTWVRLSTSYDQLRFSSINTWGRVPSWGQYCYDGVEGYWDRWNCDQRHLAVFFGVTPSQHIWLRFWQCWLHIICSRMLKYAIQDQRMLSVKYFCTLRSLRKRTGLRRSLQSWRRWQRSLRKEGFEERDARLLLERDQDRLPGVEGPRRGQEQPLQHR